LKYLQKIFWNIHSNMHPDMVLFFRTQNSIRPLAKGGCLAQTGDFSAVKQVICPLKTLNQVFTHGNTAEN
jgi:hypothetical protein